MWHQCHAAPPATPGGTTDERAPDVLPKGGKELLVILPAGREGDLPHSSDSGKRSDGDPQDGVEGGEGLHANVPFSMAPSSNLPGGSGDSRAVACPEAVVTVAWSWTGVA